MSDCRTCKYNTYQNLKRCDAVSCSHPITLAKTPRYETGDPAWVNAMTADMFVSQMAGYQMDNCATWEPKQ
jgi:hypothetical protein